MSVAIGKQFGWKINRAHENKALIDEAIYLSNANNVKGLEFPFVICITDSIRQTYKYRNILYTMLTRSFIKSFLLLNDKSKIEHLEQGLKTINETKAIKTIEPTSLQKKEIKNKLISFKASTQQSVTLP